MRKGQAEASRRAGPALHRLVAALSALTGWRRALVAAVLGAVAASALPPVHALPLLIPAFCGLLLMLDGTPGARAAFFTGWCFSFGFFLAGLYWVGIAFFVDPEKHAALMPFMVLGLAGGLALFHGAAAALTRALGWRGAAQIFLFAAAWLVAEWLRSWVLTGFPWNLMGSVWVFSVEMTQLAATTGVWGLSALTVLMATAPKVFLEGNASRAARGLAIVCLALGPLAWGAGALRLAEAPDAGARVVPEARLRIVQPAIPQELKWDRELRRKHVLQQLSLSGRPAAGEAPTHIIWAESAVPFLLGDSPDLRDALAGVVPPRGALITGTLRAEGEGETRQIFNSLQVLDGEGEIVGSFDKFHLVPFGEYVPFRSLLAFAKLTEGTFDFSAGPGPQTLAIPGLPPASPLICYEVIFPAAVREESADSESPARWLLNITNDAWFGISSGPYQHFASARLRAVEEGVPLVRAANSGISGVVDAHGRVLGAMGLQEVGALDMPLPRALETPTLFARLGNLMVLFLAGCMLSVSGLVHWSGTARRLKSRSH